MHTQHGHVGPVVGVLKHSGHRTSSSSCDKLHKANTVCSSKQEFGIRTVQELRQARNLERAQVSSDGRASEYMREQAYEYAFQAHALAALCAHDCATMQLRAAVMYLSTQSGQEKSDLRVLGCRVDTQIAL